MSSMHTGSSYCQSHESSRYLSLVFFAVLFLHSSSAHLFTGITDQFCGSYDPRHLLFPRRQWRQNEQMAGVFIVGVRS